MIDYKQQYYQLINKLEDLFIEYYDKRLVSLVLFGSVGRNKFHAESDVDILIITDDKFEGRSKRFFEYYDNIYLHLEEDIQNLMKQGINILISPVIKTKDEIEYGNPLFIEMAEECKILYDKNNFFAEVLEKLKAKLKYYKSKKVYFKGKYYWKLKPDYRWGDEIKL